MSEQAEDFLITMRDVRAAQMCSGGARMFFDQYKLDWSKFLKEGIAASELAATGDALAHKLIEVTKLKKTITNGRRR